MNFFIKFYIEIILILMIGLIMNPENTILKLSLFFVFLMWGLFHTLIIKRLFSNNEKLNDLLKDIISESEDNSKRYKIKKNIKRSYFFMILVCLVIAAFQKGGLFIPMSIAVVFVEFLKFIKIYSLIRKEKKTSSLSQEV